jgi:large subunit ribosomal protein L4
MPDVDVKNLRNEKVRTMSLPDAVFSAPVRRHILYEAVRHYRNVGRAGTHATRNRKDVSGGGRKPWRQKHTGRARHGSIRSPLWRSGGTVHGPQPRSYAFHLPRKVRRGALRAALSQKLLEERLVVVDQIELEEPKTKELRKILEDGLGIQTRVLVVYDDENRNLVLAAQNNQKVQTVRALGLNVYDLLRADYIVASAAAVERVGEVLSRSLPKGETR